jgi:hypothetical protein
MKNNRITISDVIYWILLILGLAGLAAMIYLIL